MKLRKITQDEANKELTKAPDRKTGEVAQLIKRVLKTGVPEEVTDVKKHQSGYIVRHARKAGLIARSYNKGTKVVISKTAPKEE